MERKIERLSDTKKMETEKRTNCFLDILLDLQEQNDFTDEDIREEVETFILGFMVFWLGHREKLQEKLRTEMREIFNSDIGRDVTLDDMTKMRYAESCIRETMRLLPTVPVRSYDFIRICHLDNWSCDYRTHRNRQVNYKDKHNYEFI
ncbi:unnamed protein product [Meloidogyne enterolobii]|uniref:Uncharacterized protein n=1 Tax=Meloidogyne enterolobii TaxID=390850 RepID=A0ACB1AXR7_MELEN